MNIISSNTAREIAKYSLDVSKLAATGAFITPCFSTKDVEGDVLTWMGATALLLFIFGLLVHRLADHMEGKN